MPTQKFAKEEIGPIILAGIAAGILVSAATAIYLPGSGSASPLQTPQPAAVTYSFAENSLPVRLVIPVIGVNAAVQKVGVKPDGTLDVAHSYTDVGWYEYGAYPGSPGNAVIEGHLDTVMSPYAVFFNLNKLKPGDEVDIVDGAGRTVKFSVTDSRDYPYTASTTGIFAPSNESILNLITCDGIWIASRHIYTERLVVSAKRTN